MIPLQFTIEDCQSPERLERLFRRLTQSLTEPATPSATPNLESLATGLAPLIRNQLQATGVAPLNLQSLLPGGLGLVTEDTHANRLALYPASSTPVGTLFWETDRNTMYLVISVAGAKTWRALAGSYMSGTLSPNQKPADLTVADDLNFQFYSTDFNKFYRWTGTAWERRGDQLNAGFIGSFAVGPAIGIPGWQICDGSTVLASRDDGTTANVTVPNYTTEAYLKLGSSAVVGPTAASGLTTSVSGGTPAGSVSAPVFTGTIADTTVPSDGEDVTAGAVSVGSATHIHQYTPAGTNSAPTFTGSALAGHAHGPNTLELRNTQLRGYYRL